jgi:beta-lactamase regulating signal transducer with metallopeptidase domain
MNIPAWLGPSWLGLAVLQLLQVSAVIVLVWIVTRLIGPRRPHLTHAIWLVALLKCLTPPLWASPSGAFSWIGIQEQTPAQIPATIEFAAEAARRDSLSEFRGDLTTTKPTASRETASHAIEWAHFLGAVWICGIVGMCVAVGVRAARLRRWVVRIASQTPDDVAELFSQLQARFGVRGKVKLVIVKANFGPAVFGLIRPTLVLPEELLRRDLELSPAIAHELAHLRRRDHWIGALQIAAVALWWFNPLVWWMNRQIEQARESSCDEEVIARLGCHRHEYAQMLLDIVRWRREAYWPALGVRAASVTERRLEHIVNGSQRLHRRTPALAWLMTAVMAAVLLPGAGLNRSLNAAAVAQLATPNATSSTQPAGPLHFSGQVRDKTTGKGIERATVTLHRENAREPEQWDPIGKPQLIQTDAQGRFEFSVTAAEAADSRFCLGIEVSHPRYASLMWEGEGLSLIFDEQKRGDKRSPPRC